MITAIVATDEMSGISREGKIPWYCSADLKHFKEQTEKSVLIVGANTWDTLPFVVRGRRCVVLSRTRLVPAHANAASPEEAIRHALQLSDRFGGKIYVIGGAQIYRLMLPYTSKIFLTAIPGDFKCDLTFPAFEGVFYLRDTIPLSGPVHERVDLITERIHLEQNPELQVWQRDDWRY